MSQSGGSDATADDVEVTVTDQGEAAAASAEPTKQEVDDTDPGLGGKAEEATKEGGADATADLDDLEKQGGQNKVETVQSIEKNSLASQTWFRVVVGLTLFVGVLLAIVLPIALAPKPKVRTYYIAAEDVEWDYVPQGKDNCGGHDFEYPAVKFTSKRFGNSSDFDNRIGTKYTKAHFVGYTDSTFTERVDRAPEWAHLGILGPVIRAEVGDQIHVVFRNNARFPFSVSASGVGVSKGSEGASYDDGSTWMSRIRDNFLPAFGLRVSTCDVFSAERGMRSCKPYRVHAGEEFTYVWNVPARAGPPSDDSSSAAWLYKSNHDSSGQDDLNAGLMGPIIITRDGMGRSEEDPTPKDVDREFVMLYHAVDENSSPYIHHNIYNKITRPALGLDAPAFGSVVPGEITFGHLDRATVLQALVKHAASGLEKISRSDAEALVAQSIASRSPVGVVSGRPIKVSFARDSFDPSAYDSANGGHGSAQSVLESLVSTLIDEEGDGFLESNMMHAVNGYMYCNQPGLGMVSGEKVRWYLMVAGSGVDIHTPHWHGHTVLVGGRRHDEVEMIPNTVVNADMVADNAGRWLMHCHVNDHILGGMSSLYDVNTTATPGDAYAPKTTHTYYIAAEEVQWDYLPGGADACVGSDTSVRRTSDVAETSSTVSNYFGNGGHASLGGRNLTKARYIEYTDATFSVAKEQEDPHLGILGPVIRAKVGDRIKVLFKNKASFPYSMHPHGVVYAKSAEGASYNDGTSASSPEGQDDSVSPGNTFEYVWDVPAEAGPGPNDLDSKLWMYHSHVSEVNDTNAGLIGPIVIQSSDASSPPSSHDVERFLLFNVFDETKSRYLKRNLINNVHSLAGPKGTKVILNAQNISNPLSEGLYRLTKNSLFRKYNKKHTINGRAFCTLAGLTGPDGSFENGKRVRWHLLSIGDEIDFHSPSWEGHSVESMYSNANANGLNSPSATIPLMPATMYSVDMVMRPGKWGLGNLATNHFKAGSRALFEVSGSSDKDSSIWAPASASQTDESKIARYYIAADEIEWDYAPAGRNLCSDNEFDEVTNLYAAKGPHRIGTKYIKAVYREYSSNGLFDELRWGDQSRFNPASEHLGIIGPVMKAVVGDTIEIIFRNNLRDDASLVAFGGSLTPSSVEALNDRQKKAVDGGEHSPLSVVPGGEVRITIPVSSTAGPMKGAKHNSVAYLYGSDVDFVADLNSGLVGVFIIHSQDGGSRHSSPVGIHREFVTLLNTFDENLSRYVKINTLKYAEDGDTVDFKDPDFKESNRMHSMNGFIHCNGPQASAKQFQNVRWYMLSLGNSYDLHGPSVSGYTFTTSADTAEHQVALLAPGMARTADMTLDEAGTWLVRDAVVDNQRAGMEMFFDVAAVLHPGA